MMKSRGLRPVNCIRWSLQTPPRAPRHFSTNAPLHNAALLRCRNPLLGARSAFISSPLRTPAILGTVASAIRFASTAPAAAPSASITPEPTAAADAYAQFAADTSGATLDGVTDGFLANLASMPEQIGYLKAIGLDYGWGPTACIEWLLEHVHIWTGTPWGVSIIITAVVIRAALLRFYVMGSNVTAMQNALKDVTKPIQEKMQRAYKTQDTQTVMMARQELAQVYRAIGVSPMSAFYAPIAQAVTGFCTWKLLRAMTALPVPGLETGGFLWIQDLTVADPFFVLPVLWGLTIHVVAKSGGEMGSMTMLSDNQRLLMFYGMPVAAVLFTLSMPSAVQISFLTVTILGMIQGRILKQQTIREWLGIAPIVQPSTPGGKVIDTTARHVPVYKYEAPTANSSAKSTSRGVLGSVRNMWTQSMKQIKDIVNTAKEKRESRKETRTLTDFAKKAEAYEKRRAEEDRMEKRFRRDEKQAEMKKRSSKRR